MNLENFILVSKESIIQKIITDPSITEDKKRLYLKCFPATEYTSKKTEELKDKEFILLPLNEPCLRDYHLKGKVHLNDLVNKLRRCCNSAHSSSCVLQTHLFQSSFLHSIPSIRFQPTCY